MAESINLHHATILNFAEVVFRAKIIFGSPISIWLVRFGEHILAELLCVSAPSVWNSLSYNCRSAELLSTFKRLLKTELFDIAYSEREHSTNTRLWFACDMALYKFDLLDWLIFSMVIWPWTLALASQRFIVKFGTGACISKSDTITGNYDN